MVRLQKFLAEAGLASRRAAEQLILEGRVSVNGATIRELGTKVDPAADKVALNGQPVRLKRKLYVALHKPRGYLTSRRDDAGRPLAGQLLPKEWGNLYPVGRLDFESEGLILFTNDGDFCLRLTHPRYGVRKRYIATVEGRVTRTHLEAFRRGVEDEGELLKVESARIHSVNNSHSVVELDLTEGKNREVRRLFAAQELIVYRLFRIAIGSLKLGDLPPGKWRVLGAAEIKSLMADPKAPTRRSTTPRPSEPPTKPLPATTPTPASL
jgi:pseudouridine synthase